MHSWHCIRGIAAVQRHGLSDANQAFTEIPVPFSPSMPPACVPGIPHEHK